MQVVVTELSVNTTTATHCSCCKSMQDPVHNVDVKRCTMHVLKLHIVEGLLLEAPKE